MGLETKNAKDWNNFPENAIAIGADSFGNIIVLLHNGNGILNEQVSFWNHETGRCEVIAENINELEE
ncbi:SMI1/KNR4 family protein [Flammeovirga sp. SJP92]|uniref:SMI1/KNR4 family protein n=1 Tax=Flammeovirga sp. SJP92 TaxID=1775430 RepID=UPI003526F2AE